MSRKTYLIVSLVLVALIGCGKDEEEEIIEEETNEYINSEAESNRYSRSESAEQNLLINGGLEEWNFFLPGSPSDWSIPHNEYVQRNKSIVYEGNFSAKMQSEQTGETARIDQRISVVPNHKLRIRFHYYVEQWKSKGARTYCYFRTAAAEAYNISTDELEDFYGKDTYYIIRGGGYGLTYFPHALNVWQTFDETIEVPPTANYFVFGINSYHGTTIYVDDCWVIDVTDTSTTGITPVWI